MPSGYLHKVCAERASALSGTTPVERDVMVLGAQGPDPLFLMGIFPLRPSSKPGPLGNRLHKSRTGAFLCALCRSAKAGSNTNRAYAMGFLTHYALDSTVHPYVYAHSHRENGAYSSTLHMLLEKSWDTLYFQRDGHAGTPYTMPGVIETQALWPEIARHWQGAIMEVYPDEDVTPEALEKALSDAAKATRLTHSPHGGKYYLMWGLERIMGKPGFITGQMAPPRPAKGDITNEAGVPWRNPADPETERNEGLEALFEAATRRAAELISAAGKYFAGEIDEPSLASIIGNVGYDTGLESLP